MRTLSFVSPILLASCWTHGSHLARHPTGAGSGPDLYFCLAPQTRKVSLINLGNQNNFNLKRLSIFNYSSCSLMTAHFKWLADKEELPSSFSA